MEMEARGHAEPFILNARDIELLEHLCDGLTDREIADRLKVSLVTVKRRVRTVLKKMMSASRTEAAIKALKAGILASIVILATLVVIPLAHGHPGNGRPQSCMVSVAGNSAADGGHAPSGFCRPHRAQGSLSARRRPALRGNR